MKLTLTALLLAAATLLMPLAAPLFAWAYPGSGPPIYAGTSFLTLLLSHFGLVAEAVLIAAAIAIPLGIAVTRPGGREFRAIADATTTIGQTAPPAAVLALMVPVVGFGATPTLIALALYSLMPITTGTIAGLSAVPLELLEAADGLGLTPLQRLRLVELPLAWPLILNGLRLASIIAIGTATIGSTVGALTLGTPIIGGLDGDRPGYVVQGAIVVGLLAIFVDQCFERLKKGQGSALDLPGASGPLDPINSDNGGPGQSPGLTSRRSLPPPPHPA